VGVYSVFGRRFSFFWKHTNKVVEKVLFIFNKFMTKICENITLVYITEHVTLYHVTSLFSKLALIRVVNKE